MHCSTELAYHLHAVCGPLNYRGSSGVVVSLLCMNAGSPSNARETLRRFSGVAFNCLKHSPAYMFCEFTFHVELVALIWYDLTFERHPFDPISMGPVTIIASVIQCDVSSGPVHFMPEPC